jgi:hypothetical protein
MTTRLDYIDNHAAATIVYRRNQHVINVLVWPEKHCAGLNPQDVGLVQRNFFRGWRERWPMRAKRIAS